MGPGAVSFGEMALSDVDYVVLDLETTGFSPTLGDRVVEIALLRCRPSEGVIDRFSTVVNPERAVGPSRVHRLSPRVVSTAPPFRALVPHVQPRIADAVIVAHNARFDVEFLSAELNRAGSRLPATFTLCTMRLAESLGVTGSGKSLEACCQALDVPVVSDRLHGALADAQATAGVLLRLLRTARSRGCETLADLGCVESSLLMTAFSLTVAPRRYPKPSRRS